jgi:protein associated with RNAse G/E
MIEIRKLDERGQIVFSYEGRLISAGDRWSIVEAIFTRDNVDAGYVIFRKGDRYLEWFYADRWYNIFELHDVSDDHLKGWYCNITRPATITAEFIAWPDLALDVFVFPTAEILIVDQDEFDALGLDPAIRAEAWRGVEALREQVRRRESPFHQLPALTIVP